MKFDAHENPVMSGERSGRCGDVHARLLVAERSAIVHKITLWIVLSFFVSAGYAAPAELLHCHVGVVASIKGQVELVRHSEVLLPQVGTAVCRGDVFRTASGSVASIALRDGTSLTVGRDSELVIREYRFSSLQSGLAVFELLKGVFRTISGAIARRPHHFEVITAAATIGIRGTDCWGGFGLSPNGALDVIMLAGHGVSVRNAQGQVDLHTPGWGTTIFAAGRLERPHPWSQDKIQRALATITPE